MLLFFAGNGSTGVRGSPQLVACDGRTHGVGDIPVAALARAAKGRDAVAILDAGWTARKEKHGLRAAAPEAEGSAAAAPEEDDRDERWESWFRVGVWARRPFHPFDAWGEQEPLERANLGPLPGSDGSVHGRLTHALVTRLRASDPRTLSYAGWCGEPAGPEEGRAVFVGPDLNEPVFDPVLARDRVRQALEALEREPAEHAAHVLDAAVQRRERRGEPDPAGWLHDGVAWGVARGIGKAVEALNHALDLYRDPDVRPKDPLADEHERETNYQLGRILLEAGREHSRAVDALNKAVAADPSDARAQYYLASAIRAMVERETLGKAVEAYRAYLAAGAPLGREDEVRSFLAARRSDEEAARRRAEARST